MFLDFSPLFLEFLELLSAEVTSDVRLHPSHDLAQTVVTQLLHLTQDSSPEEHLDPPQPTIQLQYTLSSTKRTTVHIPEHLPNTHLSMVTILLITNIDFSNNFHKQCCYSTRLEISKSWLFD